MLGLWASIFLVATTVIVADTQVEVPVSATGSAQTEEVPSVRITSCPIDQQVLVTDALVVSVSFGGGFQLGGDRARSVCFTINGFARECHSSYPPQWLCPELFATPAALPSNEESEDVRVLAEIMEGDGTTLLGSAECSFVARRWGVEVEVAREQGAEEQQERGQSQGEEEQEQEGQEEEEEEKQEEKEGGTGHSLPRRPILVDAVMVFDEVDMLELRMRELAPLDGGGKVVDDPSADLFLVVESEITHSGKQKEMYFGDVLAEPSSRFLPWKDRILHVVLRDDDFPPGLREGQGVYMSQHSREVFQRNQLLRALGPGGAADLAAVKVGLRAPGEGLDGSLDIVVFGDADEIPSPAAMRALRRAGWSWS